MLHDAPTRELDEPGSVSDLELDLRLDDIQREVRAQGAGIRATQRGFAIFAVLALVIAGVTLIVVAAKLDKASAPATPAAVAQTAPAQSAPAAPAALPTTMAERLTEMKITAPGSTVAAGRVTFTVTNDGKAVHEFVVLRTPIAAGRLHTSSSGRADESGNIGETGDMKVGAVKRLTLNLKPGHYALICNLPGHYKAGMYADLTVK